MVRFNSQPGRSPFGTAFHLANTLLELGELSEALDIARQGVSAALERKRSKSLADYVRTYFSWSAVAKLLRDAYGPLVRSAEGSKGHAEKLDVEELGSKKSDAVGK